MVPVQVLLCPLAAIGITGIYAAWHRFRLARAGSERVLRERVAYLLWVAASRSWDDSGTVLRSVRPAGRFGSPSWLARQRPVGRQPV